jgi:isoquinoline 1-oxidoreductase
MEPRAALAEWRNGEVVIQCGVQAPFLVRQEVARALGVPESQVRIVVRDNGGGFGGKQRGECEVEAAILARLAGAPVHLQWSREEEFTRGYSRPAGLLEVESAVDAQGRLTALRFANYNAGAAGIRPQYEVPDYWVGFFRTKSFVRQGSYRSLAAAANNFAREVHMDEWAAQLSLDPMELRLRNIADARLREVIERTAARFGWGKGKPGAGRGFGMSCNLEKDARLALFVEVDTTGAQPRVIRMTATGDFGAALNPGNLRNQMTGALLQGLGGALFERLDFDATAQRQRRLSQYRVPRFADLPEMDVQLIDRREIAPCGAGESPITLPAPAIAAALFAATGKRLRALPLMESGSGAATGGVSGA